MNSWNPAGSDSLSQPTVALQRRHWPASTSWPEWTSFGNNWPRRSGMNLAGPDRPGCTGRLGRADSQFVGCLPASPPAVSIWHRSPPGRGEEDLADARSPGGAVADRAIAWESWTSLEPRRRESQWSSRAYRRIPAGAAGPSAGRPASAGVMELAILRSGFLGFRFVLAGSVAGGSAVFHLRGRNLARWQLGRARGGWPRRCREGPSRGEVVSELVDGRPGGNEAAGGGPRHRELRVSGMLDFGFGSG